ncbi:MAG: amylo-alpha-1,6-glucosidase [Bryobacterales bacterium]
MSEVVQIKDQYYILATSLLADGRRRVIKQGETFAIFDRYGDILQLGTGEQGIYHRGTRHVSGLRLRIGSKRPLLLSSSVKDNNALVVVDLENPLLEKNGGSIPRGTIHLSRSNFLWQERCYESCQITNYAAYEVELDLDYEFSADFADIFEVRGQKRERRGTLLEPAVDGDRVVLRYHGLDGILRTSCFDFSPRPELVGPSGARFRLTVKPKQQCALYVTVSCNECADGSAPAFDTSLGQSLASLAKLAAKDCAVYTSNEQFNDWLNRSYADLRMMITFTNQGMYPFAGIPWFSTPFGRDGIITAMEALWVMPEMARGVLSYLAATQADCVNQEQDAQPGKIIHERRDGEMAALHEIPFGCYYGSVDSTPLYVILAGQYFRHSGDKQFIESIWPNIERALGWIDHYGDIDGDGFVEYARASSDGLTNQGWKDSEDSVFHASGELAEGPIALCEVQGYVYDAKQEASYLASVLGREDISIRLAREAQRLREKFEEAFWCEDISFYALALDGRKRPCCVRTSNAGHCLMSGIIGRGRAKHVCQTLFSEPFYSGWGVRTVASSEVNYNPMSYHNGSIWPHDNALIAQGLSRYGFRQEAAKILTGLFDASNFADLHRLPELLCGFPRRSSEGPTLYPVACAPQAWAAASVFQMLQACLGLSMDVSLRQLRFDYPILPRWLDKVSIKRLRVGDSEVDLLLTRHPEDVGVDVRRRSGHLDVVVVK